MSTDRPEEPEIDETDSFCFPISMSILASLPWLYGAPLSVFLWLRAKAFERAPRRGEVDAKLRDIADGIGKSLSVAWDGVRALKEHGWLEEVSTARGGAGQTSWRIPKFKTFESFRKMNRRRRVVRPAEQPNAEVFRPAERVVRPAERVVRPAERLLVMYPRDEDASKDANRTLPNDIAASPTRPDADAPAGLPGEAPPDPSVEFVRLVARYPDGSARQVVLDALKGFERTRRNGRMAASLVNAFLRWAEAYPVAQVVASLTTYLDKDCAGDGKAEAYAKGIIRNWKPGGNGNGSAHRSQSDNRIPRSSSGTLAAPDGVLSDEDRADNAAAVARFGGSMDAGGDGELSLLPDEFAGDLGD